MTALSCLKPSCGSPITRKQTPRRWPAKPQDLVPCSLWYPLSYHSLTAPGCSPQPFTPAVSSTWNILFFNSPESSLPHFCSKSPLERRHTLSNIAPNEWCYSCYLLFMACLSASNHIVHLPICCLFLLLEVEK